MLIRRIGEELSDTTIEIHSLRAHDASKRTLAAAV
jgi:hypothetical protein